MDKKIIYREVLKLKAGTHRKGFELMVSAIEKVLNEPTLGTIKLYNTLADEFNDTPSRVERALRYYVECIILYGDDDEISKLMLTFGKTGFPTVTDFIKSFAVYLKINFS